MSLTSFWKVLSSVENLEIESTCRLIPPTFHRQGKGFVQIREGGPNTLITFEKGEWKGGMSFTNVFQWTIDWEKERVSLEHLRFGENRPVFLFFLVPVKANLLKSLEPHECKEDTYFGSVLFDDHFLHLKWRVVGPKKSELTQMVYC